MTELFILEQNQNRFPNNRRVVMPRYIHTGKYCAAATGDAVYGNLLT